MPRQPPLLSNTHLSALHHRVSPKVVVSLPNPLWHCHDGSWNLTPPTCKANAPPQNSFSCPAPNTQDEYRKRGEQRESRIQPQSFCSSEGLREESFPAEDTSRNAPQFLTTIRSACPSPWTTLPSRLLTCLHWAGTPSTRHPTPQCPSLCEKPLINSRV